MKPKLFLRIAVVTMVSVLYAGTALAITQLGQNPFYSNYIESEEEMVQMLLVEQDDVKEGLTKAGMPELFDPMIAQLPEAEISKVQYSKGQTFDWMFYRKNGRGKVRIDKNVVWEGDEPIRSYEFPVDYEGQRYVFAVPPVCGNLTLVSVGPAPAPKPMAATDTSEAGSPGTGTAPAVVEEQPAEASGFPILVDTGYLFQFDPAHYLLLRVGMEFPLNDSWSIIGMIGGAPRIDGDDGKSAFIADVFANYNISRFFVGFGAGAWLTSGDSDFDDEDSDLDLIFNVGARLFGEPDEFNTSLFFEARSAVDELDDFDYYGRVGAGLRFRF